jgi:hypothetical protein
MSQGSAPAVKPTAVHEATYEVFRSLGMTTIFGNPGSERAPIYRSHAIRLSIHLGSP